MILERSSDAMLDGLKERLNLDSSRLKETVLKKLGSKSVDGKVSDNANKGPYLRAYIGKTIKDNEISPQLRKILEQWVAPLGVSKSKLSEILASI